MRGSPVVYRVVRVRRDAKHGHAWTSSAWWAMDDWQTDEHARVIKRAEFQGAWAAHGGLYRLSADAWESLEAYATAVGA